MARKMRGRSVSVILDRLMPPKSVEQALINLVDSTGQVKTEGTVEGCNLTKRPMSRVNTSEEADVVRAIQLPLDDSFVVVDEEGPSSTLDARPVGDGRRGYRRCCATPRERISSTVKLSMILASHEKN